MAGGFRYMRVERDPSPSPRELDPPGAAVRLLHRTGLNCSVGQTKACRPTTGYVRVADLQALRMSYTELSLVEPFSPKYESLTTPETPAPNQ